MRYHLVGRGGTHLGEVLLAEGVTLAHVNRELISGQPVRLAAIEPPLAAASIGDDDKKSGKPSK